MKSVSSFSSIDVGMRDRVVFCLIYFIVLESVKGITFLGVIPSSKISPSDIYKSFIKKQKNFLQIKDIILITVIVMITMKMVIIIIIIV